MGYISMNQATLIHCDDTEYIEEMLSTFANALEAYGLPSREYDRKNLTRLFIAANNMWTHLVYLDNSNLSQWKAFAPLANAYALATGDRVLKVALPCIDSDGCDTPSYQWGNPATHETGATEWCSKCGGEQ